MPQDENDIIQSLLEPRETLVDIIARNSAIFQDPRFTIKDLQPLIKMTYRKINDWDSKEIISGTRKGEESGWRRFSIVDLMKLLIVGDLKHVGLKADKVAHVMARIENYSITSPVPMIFQQPKTYSSIGLAYYFFLAWTGDKYLLVIDHQFKPEFMTDADFFTSGRTSDFSHPTVLLPFFEYVKKVATFTSKNIQPNEWTTIKGLREAPLSLKESEVLDIIRNKNYSEIKIMLNNVETLIRAKENRKGKFTARDVLDAIEKKDYQNIQVARVGGQIVSIIREETFKV